MKEREWCSKVNKIRITQQETYTMHMKLHVTVALQILHTYGCRD